jgi:hypothetical protein
MRKPAVGMARGKCRGGERQNAEDPAEQPGRGPALDERGPDDVVDAERQAEDRQAGGERCGVRRAA